MSAMRAQLSWLLKGRANTEQVLAALTSDLQALQLKVDGIDRRLGSGDVSRRERDRRREGGRCRSRQRPEQGRGDQCAQASPGRPPPEGAAAEVTAVSLP